MNLMAILGVSVFFDDVNKLPMYGDSKNVVGSSDYNVELPQTNFLNKGLTIKTPGNTTIINSYKRFSNESGFSYVNQSDGSNAGKLINLNKEEKTVLQQMGEDWCKFHNIK